MESEITALEMSNQQLEMKVRRREEMESAKNANNVATLSNANNQLLNSFCAVNSLTLAENFQALAAHNKNLLNRVAQLSDKVRFICSRFLMKCIKGIIRDLTLRTFILSLSYLKIYLSYIFGNFVKITYFSGSINLTRINFFKVFFK